MTSQTTQVTREMYETWRGSHRELAQQVAADADALRFHLMPETGWMNDPNGLVQRGGVHHIYHQYNPFDPTRGASTLWNHLVTRDFVSYEDLGPALFPDSALDSNGAYSGSAFTGADGTMHVFYTGNVKLTDRDDYDYVSAGRIANTIHLTSEDGCAFSEKRVVLTSSDYPADISCHVRDPKVLEHRGRFYMVLGARTRADTGCVLVYRSDDLDSWEYCCRIELEEPFGYMWECPDLFFLDGELVLICCPQGVAPAGLDYRNAHQCVVMRLRAVEDDGGRIVRFEPLGRPRMVDRGFDFYAPQSYADERGRRILIGWAGLPDVPCANPTVERGWQHTLTVPRELHMADGRLRQWPVAELETLRGEARQVAAGERLEEPGRVFDVELSCPGAAELTLPLREGARLVWADGVLTLDMTGDGFGRDTRAVALERLDSLRVLSDTSMLEIYVNGGEETFTARTYSPAVDALACTADVPVELTYWPLDGIAVERQPR